MEWRILERNHEWSHHYATPSQTNYIPSPFPYPSLCGHNKLPIWWRIGRKSVESAFANVQLHGCKSSYFSSKLHRFTDTGMALLVARRRCLGTYESSSSDEVPAREGVWMSSPHWGKFYSQLFSIHSVLATINLCWVPRTCHDVFNSCCQS